MELTYTMKDGYRLPDLLPPQEPETALVGNTACYAGGI